MQLIDRRLVYSAADLVAFLECRHLANLERAVALRYLRPPFRDDPVLDRMARRGREYEARFLESLGAESLRIREIRRPTPCPRAERLNPSAPCKQHHSARWIWQRLVDKRGAIRRCVCSSTRSRRRPSRPRPSPRISSAARCGRRRRRWTNWCARGSWSRSRSVVRNRAFEAPERIEAFTAFERGLASPEGDTAIAHPLRPVPQRPNRARSPRPLRARPTASALTNAAWIRCVLGGLTPLGIGRRAVGVSALAGAVGED